MSAELDDIVSVTITVSGTVSVAPHLMMPVLARLEASAGTRVRRYEHWTQVAIVFGDEVQRHRARKWLKRRAWMRRKKRRGYP